jgi:LAO/AO transport system kinase
LASPDPGTAALAEGVRAGDVRAIARAISVVEDGAPGAAALLAALFPHAGKSLVLGVTGPPGSGKSTLVDRITAHLRGRGQTVGIVAVDPTSPYSGGAILGDRIRMQAHALDEGVFIRSMATRGHLGGLSAATGHALTILSAAGKDVIVVETVGVGQDEVDIVGAADVSLVVLVPGLGDEVQALKAGIMEIADVFVVNKADRDGVERVVAEIESMLSLASKGGDVPAIVKTVATTGEGIDALMAAVEAFRTRAHARGLLRAKRRSHLRQLLDETLRARLMAEVRARALPEPAAEAVVDRLAAHDVDPFTAADEILSRLGLGAGRTYIDHLGIAVKDLAEGVRAYETLGFHVEATHDVPTEKVKTAFLPVGESHFELLEPTDPGSVIARFLEKRSGLHHVCVAVPDIQAALDALKAKGVELLDQTPRTGAGGRKVAFIHPRSAAGVLLELVERKGIE